MHTPKARRRPARVELYERIAASIHDGTYPPGSRLPTEPALATQLGVSRPALREVLILLQEDGLINVKHGVGNSVADRPPVRGFERIVSMETLLGPGDVRCRRLDSHLEEPTDFSGHHLRLQPSCEVWFWETVVEVDGAAACFAQEFAAEKSTLVELDPALADALTKRSEPDKTMLRTFLETSDHLLLTAHSTVAATTMGTARGRAMERARETPAVLVTQVVAADSTPILAAKYLVPAGAPLLRLSHRR